MRKILVIKLRYLGDVLLATSVVRLLRERRPDAVLTMAVSEGTEEVLRGNPDLDEVLVVRRGGLAAQWAFIRDVHGRRFDTVIDLTDGDRAAVLTRLSGAPVRVGFNDEHRWRGLLYTHVAQPQPGVRHRIEHDLETLRPLGIEPAMRPAVLRTSPDEDAAADRLLRSVGIAPQGGPLVALQPGARYWFKAWPAERFAALADRLAEAHGCRVAIGGNDGERPVGEAILRQAKSAPALLMGRTSLRHYAAVLKRCALFVGNDNGPMHMAATLGVPTVGLFGPSNPAEWGPRGPYVKTLYKGLDCRRCFHPTCTRGAESCMNRITVDEVFAAAAEMLTAKGAATWRAR